MNQKVQDKIENLIKEKIRTIKSVSGGCINDAKVITTESGKRFFVKINTHYPSDMLTKEANGLKELSLSNTIRVPNIFYAAEDFLILEFINSSVKSKLFYEEFGRQFAQMHKLTSNFYGFYENNYIGATTQINIPDEDEKYDWVNFYFNKRLKFQINLAKKNGYAGEELIRSFNKLESKISKILEYNVVNPSLLHGDLWGGNYMVDENGKACLIDPAVYYGHREADLAMTKLFGGFDPKFYYAYNEFYPLEAGYDYRENIYKLYHILNHLNLFGTGYYNQAVSLLKFYL